MCIQKCRVAAIVNELVGKRLSFHLGNRNRAVLRYTSRGMVQRVESVVDVQTLDLRGGILRDGLRHLHPPPCAPVHPAAPRPMTPSPPPPVLPPGPPPSGRAVVVPFRAVVVPCRARSHHPAATTGRLQVTVENRQVTRRGLAALAKHVDNQPRTW